MSLDDDVGEKDVEEDFDKVEEDLVHKDGDNVEDKAEETEELNADDKGPAKQGENVEAQTAENEQVNTGLKGPGKQVDNVEDNMEDEAKEGDQDKASTKDDHDKDQGEKVVKAEGQSKQGDMGGDVKGKDAVKPSAGEGSKDESDADAAEEKVNLTCW